MAGIYGPNTIITDPGNNPSIPNYSHIPDEPHFVAMFGPSCCGKSTMAKSLCSALNLIHPDSCSILSSDLFFKPDLQLPEYEHPFSINLPSLHNALYTLTTYADFTFFPYDTTLGQISSQSITIKAAPIILVEGHLLAAFPTLRKYFNELWCFRSTPDSRYATRLHRDVCLGRDRHESHTHIMQHLEPSFKTFINPFAPEADLLISPNTKFSQLLNRILPFALEDFVPNYWNSVQYFTTKQHSLPPPYSSI